MFDSIHRSMSVLRRGLSAQQMAAVCVLSTILASGTLATFDFFDPHSFLLRKLIPGIVSLLALTLWLFAAMQLKAGIDEANWPAEQIESLRNITESPYFTLIFFAVLVTAIFALFALPGSHRHMFWEVMILFQCASQLKTATQRRLPTTTYYRHQPIITGQIKPLQSDHWGER